MSCTPQRKNITNIALALLCAPLAVPISPFVGFALCVTALFVVVASLAITEGYTIIGIAAATLSIVSGFQWGNRPCNIYCPTKY